MQFYIKTLFSLQRTLLLPGALDSDPAASERNVRLFFRAGRVKLWLSVDAWCLVGE